jgi:hypothetical protein
LELLDLFNRDVKGRDKSIDAIHLLRGC